MCIALTPTPITCMDSKRELLEFSVDNEVENSCFACRKFGTVVRVDLKLDICWMPLVSKGQPREVENRTFVWREPKREAAVVFHGQRELPIFAGKLGERFGCRNGGE